MVIVVVNKGNVEVLSMNDITPRDIEKQGMRVLGYFNHTPYKCQVGQLISNYLGGETIWNN